MMQIYLESTPKRTFANALDWHGWSRSGRNETSAIEALFTSAPRYARILQAAGIDFTPPSAPGDFTIVERVPGDSTTEFGAPSIPPSVDSQPLEEAELARLHALLEAYWQALDVAIQSAQGKELRKGPRGGGRGLDKIVDHVNGANHGYISYLAWRWDKPKTDDPFAMLLATRQAVAAALTAAARGQTPTQRPRGGPVWSPRYFVRRVGWHVLDHTWEIEDRISGPSARRGDAKS
jgi:hypothetical protein